MANRSRSYFIWLRRFSCKMLMGFELATEVRLESVVLAAVRLLDMKLSSCFLWLLIKVYCLFPPLVRFMRFCCI